MKKVLFLFAAVVLLGLSSCTEQLYSTKGVNQNQTQVCLSEKNYKIVKNVEGMEESLYICGILGLKKEYHETNAVNEMIKNAELTGSQAIINQTFDVKKMGFFPIYWTERTVARGTVIEFIK